MGRHIRWQAIITVTGIALTLTFLGLLAFSRTTITLPDEQGTYREGIAGRPQLVNPLLADYNPVDQDLSSLIFNGLTRSDGQGGLKPDLAERWEVSEDGLAYLFKLREDIRWQDGQPVTADDVIFTVNLMQDPDFPGVPYLGDLWRSVTAQKLDDYTVRFLLAEPYPAFVDYTTIGLLPAHLLEDVAAADLISHPFNLEPVGTGPYRLEQITAQYARLSANPLYHGDAPRLANIELRFYPSYQAAIAAYQSGEVEGIGFVPPQAISDLQTTDSLNLYTARLSAYTLIYLNLQAPEQLPFFNEAKIRTALLMALDRQAIIDQALNGQGLVASGPIRSWSWAYNPNLPVIPHDPATAGGLLDEAGWIDRDGDDIRDRDGVPLAFRLLSDDSPDKIAVAEAVSEQWRQIGVAATVEVVGAGLGERLTQRDFEAALAEVMLTADPDPYPLWHRSQINGGQNYGGWDNQTASELLQAARTITSTGRRSDFYFDFQRIFAQEVPALILFHPVYTYGVNQDVLEVQLGPLTNGSDRFRTITDWYVLTQQVIYSESQFDEPVSQNPDEEP